VEKKPANGSPDWWFKVLATRLVDRRIGRTNGKKWDRSQLKSTKSRPGLELLDAYRRGEPPLQNVASEWQPHVREFMRVNRLHIADLLVASSANRMQLRDFRTAAAEDEVGDQRARDIMRLNGMKVKARDLHTDMLALGDAYTITTPRTADEKYARITAESPLEVITAHDSVTGEIIAGLKLFRDEWDDDDIAYLYLPGLIKRATKPGITTITSSGFRFSDKWSWDEGFGQDKTGEELVPGNRLPIARFQNRDGVGEFERHLGTLDRINDKIANEWWLGKLQAHRQGAVKGLPDKDDQAEDIDYTDVFIRDPAALWRVPKDVDFWESSPADMGPLSNSIQKDLERLAAVTQIALASITPDAADGSAEGAALMREEHVFKVEDRLDRAAGGWAQTMSHAFYFSDDEERAELSQLEALWGPIERFSLEQKSQAASQVNGILPTEAIYTDILQYPPAEVANLRVMRGRDMLYQGTPA
jgi:hypothetical protein